MKNNEYWKRFEQTGAITDYLNYTACTSESANQNIESKAKTGSVIEGGVRGYSEFYGDCLGNDANR